jgi:hypothetical protein
MKKFIAILLALSIINKVHGMAQGMWLRPPADGEAPRTRPQRTQAQIAAIRAAAAARLVQTNILSELREINTKMTDIQQTLQTIASRGI